ncbi:hypothetical protein L873DRAFT_1120353 [Choiromyces venosus 120613-1]|uniref:Uncharacterized protein n=1 Tax=Choiromyces venosus 120613-1 TaxID=1336337 RepID=A0A3N4JUS9_9PEZI|nr:hypothetical protein L873DRAFT_1120353 [Choiromyces venosus 120613-1]
MPGARYGVGYGIPLDSNNIVTLTLDGHRQPPRPPGHPPSPGQMLIGGVCMRKLEVTSTATAVRLSESLEIFLFGFSCPGGLGGCLDSKTGLKVTDGFWLTDHLGQ